MYSPSFTIYWGPGRHYGLVESVESCWIPMIPTTSPPRNALFWSRKASVFIVLPWWGHYLSWNLAKLQPHNISWPTHDYSFIIILSINIWEFTQNKAIPFLMEKKLHGRLLVEDHICSKQNPSPRCKWSCRFQPEPECGNGGEQPERITWGLQKRSKEIL